MGTEIEELRKAMRGAQVFGKGQYFQPGRYELEVQKCFYKRSLIEGTAKENIICEFKVLASSNPAIEVGSTCSSVFAFHLKGWLPRFKAMLFGLMGVDADAKVSASDEDTATDLYIALRSEEERIKMKLPENFLAGRRVNAEAMAGKSQSGSDVTHMKWIPVSEGVAQ